MLFMPGQRPRVKAALGKMRGSSKFEDSSFRREGEGRSRHRSNLKPAVHRSADGWRRFSRIRMGKRNGAVIHRFHRWHRFLRRAGGELLADGADCAEEESNGSNSNPSGAHLVDVPRSEPNPNPGGSVSSGQSVDPTALSSLILAVPPLDHEWWDMIGSAPCAGGEVAEWLKALVC